MKSLITTIFFVFIISMLFVNAQSTNTNSNIDKQQAWIQSLLIEQGKSINSNDYIFYCTGHHGIIWSMITRDSSGICLYNGTTRDHMDYANQSISDTLSFIENNIKIITWGLDSLANIAKLLTPLNNEIYNPISSELDIVKDGKMIFSHTNRFSYFGLDSIDFNYNLKKLEFLMYWLAAPSSRQYLPEPCDTLIQE